jgi:hypothetical protein
MTDLAEPGELWTVGQTLVWITCTTGDFASPTERDDLVASSGAPKVGEKELLPFTLFEACQEKVQNDFEVKPSQFKTETDEMLSLRFFGSLERVDRLECASLVLGQDFKCTIAKRAYSPHETRWRVLRLTPHKSVLVGRPTNWNPAELRNAVVLRPLTGRP